MVRRGNLFGVTRSLDLQGNMSCQQIKSPDMRKGHRAGLKGWA